MSLPTLQELQTMSSDTGFLQNPLEKVLRLGSILERIKAHPFLKDKLVLKGGTALNLFYFDLPRLSVDIDLNYTGSLERDEMLDDRRRHLSVMNDLFSSEYRIEIGKDEYTLTQYEFQYRNLAGTDDKLKVEINYLHRLPLVELRIENLKRFEAQIEFPVLALEELLASKVIALISRYTPRDLHDIFRLSTSDVNLDLKLTRSLILYYGIVSRVSVFELFELDLDRITDYDIRRFLHPLMARGYKPYRESMAGEVEKFLLPFLDLQDGEYEVIEAFYRTGELDMDALFPQNELREKIPMSPAFQWKVKNLREHLERS